MRLGCLLRFTFPCPTRSLQARDSKLAYGFWRPVTAIRNASTDGNPLTEQDAAWSPLTATPAHPEYPVAAFVRDRLLYAGPGRVLQNPEY